MIMEKLQVLNYLQGIHEDLEPVLSDFFFTLQALKENDSDLVKEARAIREALEDSSEKLSQLIVKHDPD